MNGRGAWWRLWYVWVIPTAIVLLNTFWLLGLRGVVLGRGSFLAKQKAQIESEVAKLETQEKRLSLAQQQLQSFQTNVDALRQRELGGVRGRLVRFLLEVVQRAEAAGLRPERIAYQAQPEKKSRLVHFTATYALSGTYEQVRRCIHLLESSPQFVVVERLILRGEEHATSLEIALQLTVGTYFSDLNAGVLDGLGINDIMPAVEAREGTTPAAPLPTPAVGADYAQVDSQLDEMTSEIGRQLDMAPPATPARSSFVLAPRGRLGGQPVEEEGPTDEEFLARLGGREASGGH